MKKVILLFLFLIVITVGCKVEQTGKNETKFDLQAEIARCDNQTYQYGRDACYSQLALDMNDNNLCNKITNISTRDECFFSFISYKNSVDKNVCDQISDRLKRMTCRARITDWTVLYDLKMQSPTLCNQYKFNFTYYNVTKKSDDECEVYIYITNYESFNIPFEAVITVTNTGIVVPVFQRNDTQSLSTRLTVPALTKMRAGGFWNTFSYSCSGNQTATFQVYPLVDPVKCLVD